MAHPAAPSPSQLRLQQQIVARLVATGVLARDLAAIAGVDDSMVSKWVTTGQDARKMNLIELVELIRHYGRDLVLGVEASPSAVLDLVDESATLTRESFDLADHLRRAMDDGRLDAEERRIARNLQAKITARLGRIGRAA